MPTDRLLHLGTGLLALSLLLALVLGGGTFPDDQSTRLALALAQWMTGALLVGGVGLLVGHLVVRALTPPSLEEQLEQLEDWYE